MAGFNLTAQLNLRGPSNIKNVVSGIRRQLSGISVDINPTVKPSDIRTIATDIRSRLGSINIPIAFTANKSSLQNLSKDIRSRLSTVSVPVNININRASIAAARRDIRRQLTNISANVNLTINTTALRSVGALNSRLVVLNQTLAQTSASATNAAASIRALAAAMSTAGGISIPQNININLNNVASSAASATNTVRSLGGEMENFGRQAGLAIRRFAAYSTVTSIFYGLARAVTSGVSAFIDFDKQLVRVAQVTGDSVSNLGNLKDTLTTLSVSYGVSSEQLANVAVTLAQAGLTAKETEKALKALALSALAPSFDDLNSTVEGSIALMRQFGISTNQLESALGSVNAVAAKFAVEASDIITAIQRTGGVFAAASRGVSQGTDALNEFVAVFTSIRATTRESAETIATGLRTIFTRIQRGPTIEALKEFGVNLTDIEGKFVGAYKAVELLSQGLSTLDPRDLRFAQIVEELGGFRQIGKVIPLIQEFATAQEALKVAQSGSGSLASDAAKGQLALAVQISKVREEFSALIRDIGDTSSFRTFIKLGLDLASGFIKLADAAKELVPLLGIFTAVRGLQSVGRFGAGFVGGFRGSTPARFATGGLVPGRGNRDTVPAMLTPGEFVINKKATSNIGVGRLSTLNKTGKRKKIAGGGLISQAGNDGLIKGSVVQPDFTYEKPSGQVFGGKYKFGPEDRYTFKLTRKNIDVDKISLGAAKKQLVNYKKIAKLAKDPKAPKAIQREAAQERGFAFEKVLESQGAILDSNPYSRLDGITKSGGVFEAKSTTRQTKRGSIAEKMVAAAIGGKSNTEKIVQSFLTKQKLRTGPDTVDLGNVTLFQDVTKGLGSKQRKYLGGYIQKFMAGKFVKSPPKPKTVSPTDLLIGPGGIETKVWSRLTQDALSSKQLTLGPDGRSIIFPDGQKIGFKQVLDANPNIAVKTALARAGIKPGELRQKLTDLYNLQRAGVLEATGARSPSQIAGAKNQNLLFGIAGIFGRRFPPKPLNLKTTDGLKQNTNAVVFGSVLDKDNIEKQAKLASRKQRLESINRIRSAKGKNPLQDASLIDRMIAPTAKELSASLQRGASASISQQNKRLAIDSVSAIAATLSPTTNGSKIFLDFDRTLSFGSDKIGPKIKGKGKKNPDYGAFGIPNEVAKGLEQARLSNLAIKLINIVNGLEQQSPGLSKQLLKRMFVVSARPQNAMPLIARWLRNKGLRIPPRNVLGVGGVGISSDAVAINKAEQMLKLGAGPGSIFIDDDPKNIGAARERGISSIRYGFKLDKKDPLARQQAATEEGYQFEKFINDNLPPVLKRAFFKAEGEGIDFPAGLDPRIANYWFNDPRLIGVPVDTKRTISGPSTIKDNIISYLKDRGYANGGKINRFADGDIVAAMVSNGEAFIPPRLAKKIGRSKLDRMNQADKNSMTGFSEGGISIFKGPGTGTSDSIRTDLPVGSYILREKATKALGLNKGGYAGKSQRFIFGGGVSARPGTQATAENLMIGGNVNNQLRDIITALNELGVASSSSARILRTGSRISVQAANAAYEADVLRLRIAGAPMQAVIEAETRLANMRQQGQTQIRAQRQLSGITGGRLENIDVRAQQLIQQAITRQQARGGTVDEAFMRGAEDIAYRRAAISGGLGANQRAGLTGNDLRQYINNAMGDPRTFEQMNREFESRRRRELYNQYVSEARFGGDRRRILQQASKDAAEEARIRRQTLNQVRGSAGPGRGMSGRIQQGMFGASFLLPMIGQYIGDPNAAGSTGGAAARAGAQGAINTVAMGAMVSSFLPPGIGQTMSILATVAAAAGQAFIDSNNAVIEFEKNLSNKKIELALDNVTRLFDELAKDINNINVQKSISDKLIEASNAATRSIDVQSNNAKMFWLNFIDVLSNNKSEAGQRSQILDRYGTRAYLQSTAFGQNPLGMTANATLLGLPDLLYSSFTGNSMFKGAQDRATVNREQFMFKMIPEQSRELSKQYTGIADNANRLIEEKIRSGTNIEDYLDTAEFENLSRSIALANSSIAEQILTIRSSTALSDTQKRAQEKAIISTYAEEQARKRAAIVIRELEMQDFGKSVNQMSRSLERMFQNMEQSINKTNFGLEQMSRDLDAASSSLTGQAKLNEGMLKSINILQNPRAYGSADIGAARSQAASFFQGNSDLVRGLLTFGEDIESTIMSTINRTITQNKDESPAKVAIAIEKAVNDQLKALQLPPDVADKLAREVKRSLDDIRKERDDKVDFSEIEEKIKDFGKILDGVNKAQDIAIKALENWQISLNSYTSSMNSLIDLQVDYQSKLRKSSELLLNSQLQLARSLGKDIDVESIFRNREAIIRQQTGGATSPADIFQNFNRLETTRRQQEVAVDIARQGGPQRLPDFIDMQNNLRTTSVALRENYDALKNLAENTDAASAALGKLQEAQQKQQGKVGFIEKLVTSTPSELDSLNRAFFRLQRNISGQLNTINNSIGAQKAYIEAINSGATATEAMQAAQEAFVSERKDTLSALNDLLPFLGNTQQSNIIRANTLEAMLSESGIGASPMFQDILNALRNPELDPETQKAIQLYQDANNLQIAANNFLADINKKLGEETADKAAKAIATALQSTVLTFRLAEQADVNRGVTPQNRALGGIIYASNGAFAPKGTDTVPAMLTPGEFVVNKQATTKNLPLLKSINSSKTSYYASGGFVSPFIRADASKRKDFQQTKESFLDPSLLSSERSLGVDKVRSIFRLPNTFINFGNDQDLQKQTPDSNFVGNRTDALKSLDLSKIYPSDNNIYPGYVNRGIKIENGIPTISTKQAVRGRLTTPTVVKDPGEQILLGLDSREIDLKTIQYETKNFKEYETKLKKLKDQGFLDKFNWINASVILKRSLEEAGEYPTEITPGLLNKKNLYPNYVLRKRAPLYVSTDEKPPTYSRKPYATVWSDNAYWKTYAVKRGMEQPSFLNKKIDQNIGSSFADFYDITQSNKNLIDPTTVKDIISYHQKQLKTIQRTFDVFTTDAYKSLPLEDYPGTKQYDELQKKLSNIYLDRSSAETFEGDALSLFDKPFNTARTAIITSNSKSARDEIQNYIVNKNAQLKDGEKTDILVGLRDPLPGGLNPDWVKKSEFPLFEDNAISPVKNFPYLINANLKDLGENFQDKIKQDIVRQQQSNIQTNLVQDKKDLRLTIGAGKNIDIPYSALYTKYTGSLWDINTNNFSSLPRKKLVDAFLPEKSNIFNQLETNNQRLFNLGSPFDLNSIAYNIPDSVGKLIDLVKANGDEIEINRLKQDIKNNSSLTFRHLGRGLRTIPQSGSLIKLQNAMSDNIFTGFSPLPETTFSFGEFLSNAVIEYAKNIQKQGDIARKKVSDTKFATEAIGDTPMETVNVLQQLTQGASQVFGRRRIPGLPAGWFGGSIRSLGGLLPRGRRTNVNRLTDNQQATAAASIIGSVINEAGGYVSNIASRVTDPRIYTGLKDTFVLMWGAFKAFDSIAKSNTRGLSQLIGSNFDPESIFRALGSSAMFEKIASSSMLSADYKNILGAQLQGSKIATVGNTGNIEQVEPINLELKTFSDLMKLALNPYSEFTSRDIRSGIFEKLITDISNTVDFRGMPYFDPNTLSFLVTSLRQVQQWYGGNGNWLGQDFLFDKAANPDPAQRSQQFLDNLNAGLAIYNDSNIAHKNLGGASQFGELPKDIWFRNRIDAGNFATGGMVYASNGQLINFTPRGTDTVPAMLTPGEFVVNREATQKNLPLLKQINSNSYMASGGLLTERKVVQGVELPRTDVLPIITDTNSRINNLYNIMTEEFSNTKKSLGVLNTKINNIDKKIDPKLLSLISMIQNNDQKILEKIETTQSNSVEQARFLWGAIGDVMGQVPGILGILGGQWPAPPFNKGGIVYASDGGHIPGMLTPGEFVVNARSASQHLPLLQTLNNGGVVQPHYYQKGTPRGPVTPKLPKGTSRTPGKLIVGGLPEDTRKPLLPPLATGAVRSVGPAISLTDQEIQTFLAMVKATEEQFVSARSTLTPESTALLKDYISTGGKGTRLYSLSKPENWNSLGIVDTRFRDTVLKSAAALYPGITDEAGIATRFFDDARRIEGIVDPKQLRSLGSNEQRLKIMLQRIAKSKIKDLEEQLSIDLNARQTAQLSLEDRLDKILYSRKTSGDGFPTSIIGIENLIRSIRTGLAVKGIFDVKKPSLSDFSDIQGGMFKRGKSAQDQYKDATIAYETKQKAILDKLTARLAASRKVKDDLSRQLMDISSGNDPNTQNIRNLYEQITSMESEFDLAPIARDIDPRDLSPKVKAILEQLQQQQTQKLQAPIPPGISGPTTRATSNPLSQPSEGMDLVRTMKPSVEAFHGSGAKILQIDPNKLVQGMLGEAFYVGFDANEAPLETVRRSINSWLARNKLRPGNVTPEQIAEFPGGIYPVKILGGIEDFVPADQMLKENPSVLAKVQSIYQDLGLSKTRLGPIEYIKDPATGGTKVSRTQTPFDIESATMIDVYDNIQQQLAARYEAMSKDTNLMNQREDALNRSARDMRSMFVKYGIPGFTDLDNARFQGSMAGIFDERRIAIGDAYIPDDILKTLLGYDDIAEAKRQIDSIKKAQNKSSGGIVYASKGQLINFQPKGTDTIPAMLTPGEFVVNRQATKQNLSLLHSINNGSRGYSQGGVVYLQDGGEPNITRVPIALAPGQVVRTPEQEKIRNDFITLQKQIEQKNQELLTNNLPNISATRSTLPQEYFLDKNIVPFIKNNASELVSRGTISRTGENDPTETYSLNNAFELLQLSLQNEIIGTSRVFKQSFELYKSNLEKSINNNQQDIMTTDGILERENRGNKKASETYFSPFMETDPRIATMLSRSAGIKRYSSLISDTEKSYNKILIDQFGQDKIIGQNKLWRTPDNLLSVINSIESDFDDAQQWFMKGKYANKPGEAYAGGFGKSLAPSAVGLGVGMALTPVLGPFGPLAGIAAGILTSYLQEYALNAVSPEINGYINGVMGENQLASILGGASASVLTGGLLMGPNSFTASGANNLLQGITQRSASGTLGGALDALIQEGFAGGTTPVNDLNWQSIITSAAIGAIQPGGPKPNERQFKQAIEKSTRFRYQEIIDRFGKVAKQQKWQFKPPIGTGVDYVGSPSSMRMPGTTKMDVGAINPDFISPTSVLNLGDLQVSALQAPASVSSPRNFLSNFMRQNPMVDTNPKVVIDLMDQISRAMKRNGRLAPELSITTLRDLLERKITANNLGKSLVDIANFLGVDPMKIYPEDLKVVFDPKYKQGGSFGEGIMMLKGFAKPTKDAIAGNINGRVLFHEVGHLLLRQFGDDVYNQFQAKIGSKDNLPEILSYAKDQPGIFRSYDQDTLGAGLYYYLRDLLKFEQSGDIDGLNMNLTQLSKLKKVKDNLPLSPQDIATLQADIANGTVSSINLPGIGPIRTDYIRRGGVPGQFRLNAPLRTKLQRSGVLTDAIVAARGRIGEDPAAIDNLRKLWTRLNKSYSWLGDFDTLLNFGREESLTQMLENIDRLDMRGLNILTDLLDTVFSGSNLFKRDEFYARMSKVLSDRTPPLPGSNSNPPPNPRKPVLRSKGGMIYAQNGQMIPYEPRGTDTVPAMLTPGEFVVNRSATRKNLPLLQSINNGSKGYSSGGIVYLQQGGLNTGERREVTGLRNRMTIGLRDRYNTQRQSTARTNEGTLWVLGDRFTGIFATKDAAGLPEFDPMENSLSAIDLSKIFTIRANNKRQALEQIRNINRNIAQQDLENLDVLPAVQALSEAKKQQSRKTFGAKIIDELAYQIDTMGKEGFEIFNPNAFNENVDVANKSNNIINTILSWRNPGEMAMGMPGLLNQLRLIWERIKFLKAVNANTKAAILALNQENPIVANQMRKGFDGNNAINILTKNRDSSGAELLGGIQILDVLKNNNNPNVRAALSSPAVIQMVALSNMNQAASVPISTFFNRGAVAIPQPLSSGGRVGSLVNFAPIGTDTIPAMLTPGEFVINKNATQNNLPLLQAINSGQYSRGGQVAYLAGGTPGTDELYRTLSYFSQIIQSGAESVNEALSEASRKLNDSISNLVTPANNTNGVSNSGNNITANIDALGARLDRFIEQLQNALPPFIRVEGQHQVNVVINGATILQQLLQGPIGNIVQSAIESAFNRQNRKSEGNYP